MANIPVTKAAFDLIRSNAAHEFDPTGSSQHPDGTMIIYIDDDVANHLAKNALDHETFSDVIVRLLSTLSGVH